jgi:hypothetical protein
MPDRPSGARSGLINGGDLAPFAADTCRWSPKPSGSRLSALGAGRAIGVDVSRRLSRVVSARFGRPGVRGRLLLAFLGISAFAVIAAAAGLYSFGEVGKALGRITEERVPGALASLELSRQAERIVAAAPALLAVHSEQQLQQVSGGIRAEVGKLEQLLEALRQSGLHPACTAISTRSTA